MIVIICTILCYSVGTADIHKMSKEVFMELSCYEELAAQAIGLDVMKYMKEMGDLKELEQKQKPRPSKYWRRSARC